ncbi:hypothetical protein [Aeromonas dhakensis]|uniref:hypothetical protein n=1 Tax=Aeromonas dhakensis TaxID=196024 RepID=UPI003F8467D9
MISEISAAKKALIMTPADQHQQAAAVLVQPQQKDQHNGQQATEKGKTDGDKQGGKKQQSQCAAQCRTG